MRAALLVNPIAGRGQALQHARQIMNNLEKCGIHARIEMDPARGFPAGTPSHAIAVGGDGTIHRWLPALVKHEVILWHAPLGTENLFARHYGMSRDPNDIRRALRAGRTARHDLGRFDGTLFAIMASLGPDAAIVRRVNHHRTGRITRLSYAHPTLQELRFGQPGHLRLSIDSAPYLERRGMLVIAVLPGYGGGLNPAWEATSDDGMLTAVHIPGRSALTVGFKLACSWLRDHSAIAGRELWHAATIEIQTAGDTPVQLDGDPLEMTPTPTLRCESLPRALRVLLPAI
ncbi:MAG: diacylglycerol kinase family protein [Planctomycetota bacterium]